MDVAGPSYPLGSIEDREDGTVVQRVLVVRGQGIWAYAHGENRVVADIYCNPQAHHIVGRLERAFSGPVPEERWCIIKGWMAPPREKRIWVEDEDEGLPRLEYRDDETR